jgi:sulfur carrier protein ThiS adenylyltransferase
LKDLSNRNARQKSLVPQDKLDVANVTVIGVGAGGRQVSIQLAAMGVQNLTLIDFDKVEVENLAPQGFNESDIDRFKVDAVADMLGQINSQIKITTKIARFNSTMFDSGVIFSCVDDMDVRKYIFDRCNEDADLLIDGRMSAEFMRIFCVHDDESKKHYAANLFPSSEAFQGSCTAKSTIYAASVSAGIRCAQFAKFLRGIPLDKEIQVNLLTNEMIVT